MAITCKAAVLPLCFVSLSESVIMKTIRALFRTARAESTQRGVIGTRRTFLFICFFARVKVSEHKIVSCFRIPERVANGYN